MPNVDPTLSCVAVRISIFAVQYTPLRCKGPALDACKRTGPNGAAADGIAARQARTTAAGGPPSLAGVPEIQSDVPCGVIIPASDGPRTGGTTIACSGVLAGTAVPTGGGIPGALTAPSFWAGGSSPMRHPPNCLRLCSHPFRWYERRGVVHYVRWPVAPLRSRSRRFANSSCVLRSSHPLTLALGLLCLPHGLRCEPTVSFSDSLCWASGTSGWNESSLAALRAVELRPWDE